MGGAHQAGAAVQLLDGVRRLQTRTHRDPLRWIQWTPPQLALLQGTGRRVLLRTGNQMGKTWAGLAEVDFRCRGDHPFKAIPPPPVEIWVITTSWSQSLAIQGKLWTLLTKSAIVEETVFDEVRGFRGGVTPVVQYRNGSIIRVKTSGQGGLKLAGATLDHVLCDEPLPSPRIYSELDRRLTRSGGSLHVCMTPVNAPVDWLRNLVEEEKLEDLHYVLSPENLIPAGSTRPLRTKAGVPMDEDWIEEQRASVLSWEAPVVLDGDWEFKAVDRVFESFRLDRHVVPSLVSSDVGPAGPVRLAIGIDYGDERLRTAAVLVAIDDKSENPRVWILDEYVPERASTLDMDARSILTMLAANDLKWADLDFAYGDKRYTDASGKLTRKSNAKLLDALEKAAGTGRGLRPKVLSAKRGPGRGRGSVWTGVRWLNDAQIRPGHFFMDARCSWGQECLLNWDGTERSKFKDWIDALRYALTPWILRRGRKTRVRPVYVY